MTRCSLRSVLTKWRDANLEVLDKTTIADIHRADTHGREFENNPNNVD
ncbi:hypothetical protein [Dyadobacter koreensis]|nr:hypothetical protein [Dyadobacter koreensis]